MKKFKRGPGSKVQPEEYTEFIMNLPAHYTHRQAMGAVMAEYNVSHPTARKYIKNAIEDK